MQYVAKYKRSHQILTRHRTATSSVRKSCTFPIYCGHTRTEAAYSLFQTLRLEIFNHMYCEHAQLVIFRDAISSQQSLHMYFRLLEQSQSGWVGPPR